MLYNKNKTCSNKGGAIFEKNNYRTFGPLYLFSFLIFIKKSEHDYYLFIDGAI